MMRPILVVLVLALWMPLAAHAIDALPFEDAQQQKRFVDLTKELRCMVCQNESLADSSAELANDLRRQIFQQMQAGKSDAEIKEWMTDRYGQFVLYDPPLKPGTWLLWFGPLLTVGVGGAIVFTIVRRRSLAIRVASATDARAGDQRRMTDEEEW